MEQMRVMEITVVSAEGLENVKHLSKMDVYVVVKISGDNSNTEQKTPVHKDGGSNPKWNHLLQFTINENLAQTNALTITFQLVCVRNVRGDKEIGEVQVPVKQLLDSIGNSYSAKYVTYPVKTPSGKPKGVLNFLYRFGEKTFNGVPAYPVFVATAKNPQYPPPPQNVAVPAYPPVGYPPVGLQQPVQEGYKPAPQPPPGYPPVGPAGSYTPSTVGYTPVGPPGGHGIPPVTQPERRNDTGSGLPLETAALLGGLLGGIMLGETVSDAAASAYDAGCDPYQNAAAYI